MTHFIEQLQSLNEPKKTKVLVVATIIVMAVVVYFWLGYFSSIVSSVPQPAVAAQDQSAPMAQQQAEPGFFQRMGSGMAAMVRAFGNILEAPRKYIVQPQ